MTDLPAGDVTTQKIVTAEISVRRNPLLVFGMSLERSPLTKLDGLTPEERKIHIEWCLTIGMVEAALYHYRLLLPFDLPSGESEALYRRIREAKASGWNHGAAVRKGSLPPHPLLPLKRKQANPTQT